MLLLHYRTLLPEQSLPVDQRWRTVELDAEVFDGLDLSQAQGIAAAIRRVNEGKVPNVEPFAPDAEIFLTDLDKADSWEMAMTVTKKNKP